ncbi:hypothetical protein CcCBS67573_g01230 [Chytriomyces confervae]|uniref:ATP-dependent DNA helicase PIF1 n=1 Tax=Chytriomyces confervae TaxID=246404 RepID=A0A507FMG7_9FUNG|nr:hypothetical protein CcCBS67573_g01230 [Chytriomyces confervae]
MYNTNRKSAKTAPQSSGSTPSIFSYFHRVASPIPTARPTSTKQPSNMGDRFPKEVKVAESPAAEVTPSNPPPSNSLLALASSVSKAANESLSGSASSSGFTSASALVHLTTRTASESHQPQFNVQSTSKRTLPASFDSHTDHADPPKRTFKAYSSYSKDSSTYSQSSSFDRFSAATPGTEARQSEALNSKGSFNGASNIREFKTSSYAPQYGSGQSQFRFMDESSQLLASKSAQKSGLGVVNESAVQLTREQTEVLSFVSGGESVFYTGSAGTGKSVLMREIIRVLKLSKTRDQIAITAPTGIAASNIGGTTLHSFAGCGLAKEPAEKLIGKIKSNRQTFTRWRTTQVLIIDEISMVDGYFFDKLEEIARMVRDSPRPFGGIQLVICGDFMQLPPVSRGESHFAFEAKSWKSCMSRTILLKEVFRQKDPVFVQILNEMRNGLVTPATESRLRALSRPIVFPTGKEDIVPTELFATRNQVDACNRLHLNALPGEIWAHNAKLEGDDMYADKLKDCLAPERLELKVGAQVMLIKNLPDISLVNGSLGRVIGFDSVNGAPVVDFYVRGSSEMRRLTVNQERWSVELPGSTKMTVKEVARVQFPLLLAYALSIHKSQGQTIEYLRVDLGKVFEKGQTYVALSRAVSLDGLQVVNFRKDKVMAHHKVIRFHQELLTL